MKLAITVWEDRVSPLCDSARCLLVVIVRGGRIMGESRIPVDVGKPNTLASKLGEQGVDVLICGAISESLSALLEQYLVQVVPFVSGKVIDVLKAFCRKQLDRPEFKMPGHSRGRKQHFRRRLGGRRGQPGNMFNL